MHIFWFQVLHFETQENCYKTTEKELNEKILEIKETAKKNLEAREAESKAKMLQLEAEVQKQRERTIGTQSEQVSLPIAP